MKRFIASLLVYISCYVCFVNCIEFHATVAQDRSGNYVKISDAINNAPSFSQQRYYIRIKPGRYKEHVEVGATKHNIALVGDDATKTYILDDRSDKKGYRTSDSATMVVDGVGFLAIGLTFMNSAGPEGGQAVAVMNNANMSTFYRCNFLGFQDTLLARQHLQFYRECTIYGSVDFIFGAAKAVFQKCNLYARAPKDVRFTAQSKNHPREDSGFAFQECRFAADPRLASSKANAMLGRPWANYALVVIMDSFLDRIIDPLGFEKFVGDQDISQVFYGEYRNNGPGADTSRRVRWPGVKVLSLKEARRYTVRHFIVGDQWIPREVPFYKGLKE